MNEFYWAVMGVNELLDPLEDAPPVRWLTKSGELETVEIKHPSVKLFDTDGQALLYIVQFLDDQNCKPIKIHKDFIYV